METVDMCKEKCAQRSRTPNYTAEEKVTLLEIITRYKNIIENKKTNAVTWREKDLAWAKVAGEFNAITPAGVFRDKNTLKKFYENKKKEVRNVVAEDKRKIKKTGGGPYVPTYKQDACYDMVLEMANKKTFVGLHNDFDGDAEVFEENKEIKEAEFNETNGNETIIITMCDDDDENLTEISEFVSEHRSNTTNVIGNGMTVTSEKKDWAQYKPADLKKPVSKKLVPNENWTNRRRPRVIEPIHTNFISKQYSEVATLKKIYFEQEIQIAKDKEKRDVEEFQLRKRALTLDISIKDLQLKRLITHSLD